MFLIKKQHQKTTILGKPNAINLEFGDGWNPGHKNCGFLRDLEMVTLWPHGVSTRASKISRSKLSALPDIQALLGKTGG